MELIKGQYLHRPETDSITIMCHPYFMVNLIEPYLKLHSYIGLEAYNFVCNVFCGREHAEIYWNALLLRGKHLLGFASDDSHDPDFGHAWLEVKAKEKTYPLKGDERFLRIELRDASGRNFAYLDPIYPAELMF